MDSTNKFFLPGAVILAGLLIAGAVLWNGSSSGTPNEQQTAKADIKDVDISGAPFIGAANAPVTIAVWSDFQCPFCKRFEVETLPRIIQEYGQSGKVKIVFLDFAFLGEDSTNAGVYNRAVWKLYPEMYYAWRGSMFEAQDDEGDRGFGDAKSIEELTAKIPGIDVAKVSADVKANREAYIATMTADREQAIKFGINATPSFIIGTEVIAGAYPYETFKAAIDAQLK